MRKKLCILIDTATTKVAGKYGNSAAFWAAMKDDKSNPIIRYGLAYSHFEGPNNIFYIGILCALLNCYNWKPRFYDSIEIMGDCRSVIDQLIPTEPRKNGVMYFKQPYLRQTHKMKYLRDPVIEIQNKYEAENISIKFCYISDRDKDYRRIDAKAKSLRTFLRQQEII